MSAHETAKDLVQRDLAAWNVEYRKIGDRAWKDFRSTLEDPCHVF